MKGTRGGRAWSTHVFIYILKTHSTFIWRSHYRQTCENKATSVSFPKWPNKPGWAWLGMEWLQEGRRGRHLGGRIHGCWWMRCLSIRDQRNKGDKGDSRCGFDPISKCAFSRLAFSCFSRCLIISILLNDIPKSWEENLEFPSHFCSPPFHFRFVWTSDAVAALTVQHIAALSPTTCGVLSYWEACADHTGRVLQHHSYLGFVDDFITLGVARWFGSSYSVFLLGRVMYVFLSCWFLWLRICSVTLVVIFITWNSLRMFQLRDFLTPNPETPSPSVPLRPGFSLGSSQELCLILSSLTDGSCGDLGLEHVILSLPTGLHICFCV